MGETTDVRGDARLIDTAAAVQLVLASRDLVTNERRLMNMVAWLIGDVEVDANGTISTRLFVAAIEATKR